MDTIRRLPLAGKIISILIILMLITMTSIAMRLKNQCRKLEEANMKLTTEIENLHTTNVHLLDEIRMLVKESDNKEQTLSSNIHSLGQFRISAYCNCRICCGKWAGGPTASGTMPVAGRTIAVDPNIIPLGSKVIIDGYTYIAEDTGSAIKGNRIDMYFDSHQEALKWGIKYIEVNLIK